jgi:hypothetical protein
MGWDQLVALTQERIELARLEASTPPTACWLCGTPLGRAPDGGLKCQADGWTPDDMMGELRS